VNQIKALRGSLSLVVITLAVGLPTLACSSGGSDGVSGSQDVTQGPPAAGAPSAPGTANPATPSPGPAATAPAPSTTVLVDCVDKTDPTAKALLTIDSSFKFSWTLVHDTVTGTLYELDKEQDGQYLMHGSDGHFVAFDPETNFVDMGGLDVECDTSTAKIDTAAFDRYVAITATSQAKQEPFATCQLDISGGTSTPSSWTVRPSLDGSGAIIEGDHVGDEFVALLVTSIDSGSGGATAYKGLGSTIEFAAGQHVTTFTTLTGTPGSDGTTTFSWDRIGEDGQPAPLPSNSCKVTGADIAKSLLAQH
jgi:hypothetical protein